MVLGHDTDQSQRTQDINILENVSFDTMLLNDNTLKGLRKSGFYKPSPIQLHGIPLGKCGFDLLLEAKSGTGKTAVFTVIALEKLDLTQGLQTIILAPTREIAFQICEVITILGTYYKGLNVAVVMGGLPLNEDIEKFKNNVHIVVGSPGRLRHLIEDKHIDLSTVRLLVLDEADKLMEKSFNRDINYIFSLLPKQKQVIMSSATYPEDIKAFIGKYVKKAQHICPDSNSILLGIEQKIIIVPYNCHIVKQIQHRYEELKKILASRQFKQCLIFCNYQVRVAEIHRLLTRDKWPSEQLCGNQDQNHRLDALKTLQDYKCRILVSTDLAARGIDASNVDLVINFEPPHEWQTYLHRIGRAGRYGSYGLAISILCEGKEKTKFIETLALSNMTLNLRCFWSNEPFKVDLIPIREDATENDKKTTNVTSDSLPTISEDNLTLFSNLNLRQEDCNIKQPISSFEELFESFKKSCEITQSPNENLHQEIVEELNLDYKHVMVSNEVRVIENVNGHSQSKKYDSLNFPDYSNKKSLHGCRVMKNTAMANKSVTSKSDKSESRIPFNNKFNYSDDKIPHQNGVDVDDDIKNHNTVNVSDKINNSKDIEYNSSEHALIEAGLPKAFGKPNRNQEARTKRVNTQHNCNNFENKTNIKCNLPTYNHLKTHNVIKNSKPNHKQLSESSEESDQSDNSYTTISHEQARVKRKHQDKVFLNHNSSQQYKFTNICDESKVERRRKDFDVWYSQLRWQSHFLQYALYLEELKKL